MPNGRRWPIAVATLLVSTGNKYISTRVRRAIVDTHTNQPVPLCTFIVGSACRQISLCNKIVMYNCRSCKHRENPAEKQAKAKTEKTKKDWPVRFAQCAHDVEQTATTTTSTEPTKAEWK